MLPRTGAPAIARALPALDPRRAVAIALVADRAAGPHRDRARDALDGRRPCRTDRGGQAWLDEAFTALDRRTRSCVSWWSYSTTLWYGQLIEGRRPDLLIIDDRTRLDEGLGESRRT